MNDNRGRYPTRSVVKDEAILWRLEASLRAAGAEGRETVTVGPFRVFFAPSPDYLLSLAVPHGPEPERWTEGIAALREVFAERGRRPRLEFFRELHPTLAGALEAAGLRLESAAPVMTLEPRDLAPAPERGGAHESTHVRYVRLQADDREGLGTFLRRQSLAYGGLNGEPLAWLPSLERGLRNGTLFGTALSQGGEFVSGATIQIGGDVGELAGVWTLPERRRQGLAFGVCQQLLSDFFSAGYALSWLSAAEGAEGLYRKLGFKRVGTQLNYGVNDGGPP